LKVSANVRIAIQYFENNFGGGVANAPPGCVPGKEYMFIKLYELSTWWVRDMSNTSFDVIRNGRWVRRGNLFSLRDIW